jgi:hypothetical protein
VAVPDSSSQPENVACVVVARAMLVVTNHSHITSAKRHFGVNLWQCILSIYSFCLLDFVGIIGFIELT